MLAPLRTAVVRNRKPLAVAGSVGLHLVVIWLLIQPSSSALSELDKRAYGQATQTGIDLDLVPPAPDSTPKMPAAPPKPPAPQPMAAFATMTQPATATSQAPLSAPTPVKSLSEVFGKDVFSPSRPIQQHAETQNPSDQKPQVKIETASNRTTPNDLWKAIEPCWRRIATKETEGVILSVSFSPLGNLAKPPVIKRANGEKLDDRRLKSESLAINALAQCGPYLMAFGQSDVSVEFPAGG